MTVTVSSQNYWGTNQVSVHYEPLKHFFFWGGGGHATITRPTIVTHKPSLSSSSFISPFSCTHLALAR